MYKGSGDFNNFISKEINVENETERAQNILYKMNSMRKNGLFCDVTLVTKTSEIPAHKVVLASCSKFFENRFITIGQENRLYIEEIKDTVLLSLISYIYTSNIDIEINPTNIQDLLIGASILQLNGIRNLCCKYLEDHLNINTALEISSIAYDQTYIDLYAKTQAFIDKNIMAMLTTKKFLNLSIDQLKRLISRDTLAVPSEEKIYEGVISWLKHDPTNRSQHLSDLMSHVRLALIPADYVAKHIITEPLIQNDLKSKDLIINALLNEHIPQMIKPIMKRRGENVPQMLKLTTTKCGFDLDRKQDDQTLLVMGSKSTEAKGSFSFLSFNEHIPQMTKPIMKSCGEHVPQMLKLTTTKCGFDLDQKQEDQILLVMGGKSTEAKETYEFYDFKTNSWSKIYSMPVEKSECNLAYLNRKIYIVNGDGITDCDLEKDRWCDLIKIPISRKRCGVGVLNNNVYAVGGINDAGVTQQIAEKLDISTKMSKFISFMPDIRIDFGIGVLDGLLYIVGGKVSPSIFFYPTQSVHFYDPKLDVFKPAPALITARWEPAVGILHNKMYVIGGYDGVLHLNSVEYYSSVTNKFIQSASLNIPRSKSTAVVFDDKLYVIGGYNKGGYLDTIEVYCPKIDKWELLPTKMNVARSYHGAIIIEKTFQFK